MRNIAAYALLVLGGKEAPTADEVEQAVKGAGAEPEKDKIALLCRALEGKPLHELVQAGMAKLASMGTGAPAPSSVAADGEAGAQKAEEKPVEEPEDDIEMIGMFGDDDDY